MMFIHSDLIIDEYGFDVLLREVFAQNPKIGLVGFVGSDEMTAEGGRGLGTTSNFGGKTYTYKNKSWKGSPALFWGRRFDGLTNAVVIDGCSMAVRRTLWEKIKGHPNHSIIYNYDKLISLQTLEAGYKVAVLGVLCDHISNQTASNEKRYHSISQGVCEKNNVPTVTDRTGNINWDMSIHAEAKRRLLKEWRDEKHFIPRQA